MSTGTEHHEEQEGPEANASKPSRFERRATAATDAIRTLVRDLYTQQFGPEAPPMHLTLELTLRDGAAWDLSFEPALGEQLKRQFQDAQADFDVYREGRVYSFRHDTSSTQDAVPPSPLHVFTGYSETGAPEWQELTQVFIDARDARVDQLFAKPPRAITTVQLGRSLRYRQLSSFGRSSKTYSILGQVIAGYYPLPTEAGGNGSGNRVAVTFQVVETRGRSGEVELYVNPVASLPSGVSLADLFASGWQEHTWRALQVARRRLGEMEVLVREARQAKKPDAIRANMGRIPAMLHQFAASIERGHRQATRRTYHAESRRKTQRPVHKAMDDVLAASPDGMYYDRRKGTMVACGNNGRTHIFSAEGRHVTSFVIKPAAIEYRLRTERWRALQPEEAEQFKRRVQQNEVSRDHS